MSNPTRTPQIGPKPEGRQAPSHVPQVLESLPVLAEVAPAVQYPDQFQEPHLVRGAGAERVVAVAVPQAFLPLPFQPGRFRFRFQAFITASPGAETRPRPGDFGP